MRVGNSPARASSTDRVLVTYRGTLEDGTEFDGATNAAFARQGTISGFREGITGIRIGGERRITIPPLRGYGPADRLDADGNVVIPGCSVLFFEVELVDILS